jgi:hypothetical protein
VARYKSIADSEDLKLLMVVLKNPNVAVTANFLTSVEEIIQIRAHRYKEFA